MLHRRVSLLLLLAACGPGEVAVSTTGPGTTASTGQPTSETTDATTTADSSTGNTPTSTTTLDTSTSDTSTGATTEPATGPVEPGTSSADTTSTSTGTDGTDTDSDSTGTGDTDAADVAYAAFFWAGGLDHVMIHRADFTHDRCTTLHLAWPGAQQPALPITAPDGYAAHNAQVAAGVDGCLAGMPTGEVVAAASGSGVVGWSKGPQEYCPLQLDVDVTLEFPLDMPWVPAQELLQAVALTVQNCP